MTRFIVLPYSLALVIIPRRKAVADIAPPYGRLGRLDDLLDFLQRPYIDSLGSCN